MEASQIQADGLRSNLWLVMNALLLNTPPLISYFEYGHSLYNWSTYSNFQEELVKLSIVWALDGILSINPSIYNSRSNIAIIFKIPKKLQFAWVLTSSRCAADPPRKYLTTLPARFWIAQKRLRLRCQLHPGGKGRCDTQTPRLR